MQKINVDMNKVINAPRVSVMLDISNTAAPIIRILIAAEVIVMAAISKEIPSPKDAE